MKYRMLIFALVGVLLMLAIIIFVFLKQTNNNPLALGTTRDEVINIVKGELIGDNYDYLKYKQTGYAYYQGECEVMYTFDEDSILSEVTIVANTEGFNKEKLLSKLVKDYGEVDSISSSNRFETYIWNKDELHVSMSIGIDNENLIIVYSEPISKRK